MSVKEIVNQYSNLPQAEKAPVKLVIHGDVRVDNYYWLKERENPKVIEYLEEENKYLEDQLDKGLTESLFQEIIGRIKKDDDTVPCLKNGYYYQTKFIDDLEYGFNYRIKSDSSDNEEPQLILDENELAEGQDFCDVASLVTSPSNEILAYGVDFQGRRQYEIRFKNLTTGQELDFSIDKTMGSPVWKNDSETIFYLKREEEDLRPYQLRRFNLKTREDTLIYQEEDDTFWLSLYKSKDQQYIILHSGQTIHDEAHYLDANAETDELKLFHRRERGDDDGVEYGIDHAHDQFYIRTNDKAKNFKLMTCLDGNTSKSQWHELIPHREDVLLESFELFQNFIVLVEREMGLIKFQVIQKDMRFSYYIDFGEECYSAALTCNYELKTDVVRYSYNSLTRPEMIIDFHMGSCLKKTVKEKEIVGDFNKDNYVCKKIYAQSHDGKQVAISLCKRKDAGKTCPLYLYGYGAYGVTMDPIFKHHMLSLLDRGFSYAIAHVRGSEYFGREWYDDGRYLRKMNTFLDFISCAEELINAGYTRKDQLFAYGGSAGGLLMGAVSNMRPDLFKGIIADVPYLDALTTMLDPTIPLTSGEYDETGNPEKKEEYFYMKQYSPYDNVKKQNYPNMLIMTGFHDSQVQYWEPAKWTAKLREMKTDDNLLLLKTDMNSGHGGASGRFEFYKDLAVIFNFVLSLT